ncbi:APC family permease [Kytococcus sedentarius]|uniref:Amino acid transporter n=1 Tax=Kytococcus sedentarius (strain ATCC 14392 / DSM 20547 / JCM 11482 / CCUG 33030 / NBRC 15357 / NCTC 11040 / CCM 314 / 541) TaxID=478801 RepID=C7NI06_KYTSD|nr:APC family permease [Kytococcus sedentarius]ACV06513.1 amino acid transporter [Kytococcus sedentarius DSM 20547]STX12061.1 Serine/threonine exchanger SteT [Kytococcus sedentarius]
MSGATSTARHLTFGDALTIGLAAMVGAGVFGVWGPAVASAGNWLLPALAVAALVAWCNASSSAQLAARHPGAGGTYLYGRERLSPFWGHLAGWCFVVGKTASCAAMALVAGAYLWPGWEKLVAVLAVLALTAVTFGGVVRSARVARGVVAVVLVGIVATLLLSWVLPPDPTLWTSRADPDAVSLPSAVGPASVLQAAGLLFFAFAGYARIATLGDTVVRPERTIPRAIGWGVAITLTLYAAVAVTLLVRLRPEGIVTSAAPLRDLAGGVSSWWALTIGVVAGLAALGALWALLLGVGRTLMAMGERRDLPAALGVTATAATGEKVPRVASLLVAAVVVLLVLVVDLRGAIGFSSFGVLLYYAVANAAAFTLRHEWRAGWVVPLLGLAGCLALAASLPLTSVIGGLVLVALGVGVWVARRDVPRRVSPPRGGRGPRRTADRPAG